jgi:GDP-fucose protein O-fucosyltransferase
VTLSLFGTVNAVQSQLTFPILYTLLCEVRHMSAEAIYEKNTKQFFKEGRTVYIATDEQNITFFEPFAKHYNVLFLGDFKKELVGVNTNFYGMIDQLVASRGDVFTGVFFSTFTGTFVFVFVFAKSLSLSASWNQYNIHFFLTFIIHPTRQVLLIACEVCCFDAYSFFSRLVPHSR